MCKLQYNRVFRLLVCLILVASFLINLSPLKAEAFVVEATTVSAVGLTLYLYLLWSGFVVPPPDIGIYQDLDDSFRHYLDDLGIDESSWASDADDLDDEWESSDSSDGDGSDSSGSVTINVGQTLRNLMRAFVCGGLVKASIDLLPDLAEPTSGWSYYGSTHLPTLTEYSDCPYVVLYYDGSTYCFLSTDHPVVLDSSKGYFYITQKTNFYYDYAPKSSIASWNINSKYLHDNLKTHTSTISFIRSGCSKILWSNYDVLSYRDGSVLHSADSDPITAEDKYLVPSAILGSIAGGVQNGTLAEEDVNLPPILDISSVIKSGMANYHEDMVQAAQDLIDGRISHEDFQEQLAYNEDTGEDIPGVNDPIVNPDDPGSETTPSTGTEPWEPPEDPGKFALDLSKVFPFCIPFDLYAFLTCLNADPVTPVIHWEIAMPGGGAFPLEIDLSPFNSVAQLLRRLELLLFCVGLAMKTRDLIKG